MWCFKCSTHKHKHRTYTRGGNQYQIAEEIHVAASLIEAPSAATFHSPTHPTRPLHTSLPPSPSWTHPYRVYFILGKPLTVDISSEVDNLDQVIPGRACQPVSIVVPFDTHHSSLVGMAKFRKVCVKVKLNSHMLSSRNITYLGYDHMHA